jgi:hypothetical protein
MKHRRLILSIPFIVLILSITLGFFMSWELISIFSKTGQWEVQRPDRELTKNIWLLSIVIQGLALLFLGVMIFQKAPVGSYRVGDEPRIQKAHLWIVSISAILSMLLNLFILLQMLG